MVDVLKVSEIKVVGSNYQLTATRPDGSTIEILVPIKPISLPGPYGLNLVFTGDHYE